jgi:hypothetical protein
LTGFGRGRVTAVLTGAFQVGRGSDRGVERSPRHHLGCKRKETPPTPKRSAASRASHRPVRRQAKPGAGGPQQSPSPKRSTKP